LVKDDDLKTRAAVNLLKNARQQNIALCLLPLTILETVWVLEKVQFLASLILIACINLGVFAKYSSFFLETPVKVAETILVAFILSAICHMVGFSVTWGMKREDRLAGAISFAYMNNVLVVVLSSQFFGPLSPTLAVLYMLPFFTMIVPARIVGQAMK